jgi:hypothetical protein
LEWFSAGGREPHLARVRTAACAWNLQVLGVWHVLINFGIERNAK